MKMLLPKVLFLLFSVFIAIGNGQKFSLGSCPVPNSALLTLAKLVDTWRVIYRPPSIYKHGWSCITYTVSQSIANIQYAVVMNGYKKLGSVAFRNTGVIEVFNPSGTTALTANAYLTFRISDSVFTKPIRYYVIATDSVSAPTYLVLYACDNLAFGKLESAIILANNVATDLAIQTALTALASAGYPISTLERTYTGICTTGATPAPAAG